MGNWITLNMPWDIKDDRVVEAIRQIVAEKISIQLSSVVGSRMKVTVAMTSLRRIEEIVDGIATTQRSVGDIPIEGDTLVFGDIHQDSIEIGPAGNRIKVYGDSSDVEKFKEKIDVMMVLQDYATREYERKAEVRRRAPKSKT